MRHVRRTHSLAAMLVFVAIACAPSTSERTAQIHISIPDSYRPPWAPVGDEPCTLSDKQCYAIRVTGSHETLPGAEIPASLRSCRSAEPTKLGAVFGLYPKGKSVEIQLPVGKGVGIHLLATPKTATELPACSGNVALAIENAATGAQAPKKLVTRVNGTAVVAPWQVLASANTEIKAGINEILLQPLAGNTGLPVSC